jgi:hypothetical protein
LRSLQEGKQDRKTMTDDFLENEIDPITWNKMEHGILKISKRQKLRINLYLKWYFLKQKIKQVLGIVK